MENSLMAMVYSDLIQEAAKSSLDNLGLETGYDLVNSGGSTVSIGQDEKSYQCHIPLVLGYEMPERTIDINADLTAAFLTCENKKLVLSEVVIKARLPDGCTVSVPFDSMTFTQAINNNLDLA